MNKIVGVTITVNILLDQETLDTLGVPQCMENVQDKISTMIETDYGKSKVISGEGKFIRADEDSNLIFD